MQLKKYIAIILFAVAVYGCSVSYVPVGLKIASDSYDYTSYGPDFSVTCSDMSIRNNIAVKINNTPYRYIYMTNRINTDSLRMPDILNVALIDPDSKEQPRLTSIDNSDKPRLFFAGSPIKFAIYKPYSYSDNRDTAYLQKPSDYIYISKLNCTYKRAPSSGKKQNDTISYIPCNNNEWHFTVDKYENPVYLNIRITYSYYKNGKRDTINRIFPFMKTHTPD